MIAIDLGVNCVMRNKYIMRYYACLVWIM